MQEWTGRSLFQRGFGLVEILIAIALFSTAFLYFLGMLTSSNQAIKLSSARICSHDLQAVTCINRWLAGGANTTLQVQSSPAALKFLSAEPPEGATTAVNAQGELLWQQWVCLYHDARMNRLLVSTQTIAPQPTIASPAPGFAAMMALPSRVVCRDITAFNLTQIDTRTVRYSITSGAISSGQPGRTGVATYGRFTLGH